MDLSSTVSLDSDLLWGETGDGGDLVDIDDINSKPFTTLLSSQMAEWLKA